MAALTSSREMAAALDDVPAVIRIRSLQCTIQGPGDAWGRRSKPQPMSISADVSLNAPFGSSSANDAVAPDTVHYGLLSKAILASLAAAAADEGASSATLYDVLDRLWIDVTAHDLRGSQRTQAAALWSQLSAIRGLRMSLQLPKASRLGGVVSLTGSTSFQGQGLAKPSPNYRSLCLGIHGLRLPVLIGVNENERQGKQVVVANVDVDKFEGSQDEYCGLEEVIERTMDASSFETLEALAAQLAQVLTSHLKSTGALPSDGTGCQLKIALEKPIAVPLAEAVCVELRTNTNDVLDTP